MAHFNYNDGNPKELVIGSEHKNTKLYVGTSIKLSGDSKISGYTRIFCADILHNKAVECKDVPLTYAKDLDNKVLYVDVDLTKWNIADNKIVNKSVEAACTLVVEAGDVLLEEFVLNDSTDCTPHSVFHYSIKLKLDQP